MNSNINFSLKSMMDDFGRVFLMNNRVYRAIQPEQSNFCLSLLNSDLFKELETKGLVPKTTISEVTVDDYSLVLEHEKLVEVLQHEWSFSMLKDAAKMIWTFNEICNKYGYEIKDAHTLNVLFRGTQPVLVDIGSIAIKSELKTRKWIAYEEYLGSFIMPLLFWSEKKVFITRKLLESNFYKLVTIPAQGIVDSGLLSLLSSKYFSLYNFKVRNRSFFSTSSKWKVIEVLTNKTNGVVKLISKKNKSFLKYGIKSKKLSDYLQYDSIKKILNELTPPLVNSKWQGYHNKFYNSEGKITPSSRFYRILELIKNKESEINSIIDLAGNEGYFSLLLKQNTNIKRIILADYDENAIDTAYNSFKDSGTSNIHTVLLNFMFTPDLSGTTKRLRSDMAIALAVTHHLILSSNFSLAAIFERLKLYSNKYVIVEFMPLGLWAIGDTIVPELPDGYNVNWFKQEFEKYFELLIQEQLEDNRILFMGTIKS